MDSGEPDEVMNGEVDAHLGNPGQDRGPPAESRVENRPDRPGPTPTSKEPAPMRRPTLFLIAALAPAAGCGLLASIPTIQGSGVAKEESRTVETFTGVEVGGVIEATVTAGPETAVRVSGDDNLVPLVVTEVHDGRLSIRTKGHANVRPKLPLKAEVTAPKVTSVGASGAARLRAAAGEAERFEARAGGASHVSVEGLKAAEARIEADGASEVTASGATRSLKAEASGASRVHAEKLAADEAEVNFTGASGGAVRAAKTVRGDVSGASNVRVTGRPETKAVRTSGASGVTYREEP
jgi:Putative auto-transporter adhesin, head GIN domain